MVPRKLHSAIKRQLVSTLAIQVGYLQQPAQLFSGPALDCMRLLHSKKCTHNQWTQGTDWLTFLRCNLSIGLCGLATAKLMLTVQTELLHVPGVTLSVCLSVFEQMHSLHLTGEQSNAWGLRLQQSDLH